MSEVEGKQVKGRPLTTEEQLRLLKMNTVRMGAISGAQTHQLQMWGGLYPKVEECEININIEERVVYFIIKGKRFKKDKYVKNLNKNLISWTRFILWDDTRIVVKRKSGNILFDSSKWTE